MRRTAATPARLLFALGALAAAGCTRARPLSLEGAFTPLARPAEITKDASSRDAVDEATWAALRDADYLAIGPRELLVAAAPLFEHRRALGHRVVTIASEALLERLAKDEPDAAGLTRFVGAASARSAGKLRFLLLLGDAESEPGVPTHWLPKLRYDDADGDPTPRFGGLLGGGAGGRRAPSEPDGEGFSPAFPSDGPYARAPLVDRPEAEAAKAPAAARLAVGRVPARSADHAAAFARKVIAYETSTKAGAWQRRLSVLAGPPGFGGFVDGVIERTAERMLDEEVSYDFDVRFFFAAARSPYAPRLDRVRERLADELGRGALIAGYVGHGDSLSFDSVEWRAQWYPLGHADDAIALDARAGNPFFVSLACDTGALDRPERRPSLAVELVLNERGAIAAFAASRESHPYANALYGQAILATFVNGRPRTLGEGILAVQDRVRGAAMGLSGLLVRTDVAALKEEHEGLYNLLGDPATRLRYPSALRVTLAADGRPKAGGRVKVALRVEGEPAKGATRARVTLETRRSVVRGAIVTADALEAMPLPRALEAMEKNATLANDKVVAERTVKLEAGAGELELELPKTTGSYVVKAITEGGPAAIGHVELVVAQ